MRTWPTSSLLVLVLASTAAAQAPVPEAPRPAAAPLRPETPKVDPGAARGVDIGEVPPRCADLVTRANGGNRTLALPARISLANCLADARVGKLQLIDGAASVLDIDAALAPSLDLLDQVVRTAEPATRIMAHDAKARLLAGATNRVLATVPPLTATTPEAVALRDSRRQLVDAMVTPWRERAMAEHLAIVELAKAQPALATDRTAGRFVKDSRGHVAHNPQLATAVATRKASVQAAAPAAEPNSDRAAPNPEDAARTPHEKPQREEAPRTEPSAATEVDTGNETTAARDDDAAYDRR